MGCYVCEGRKPTRAAGRFDIVCPAHAASLAYLAPKPEMLKRVPDGAQKFDGGKAPVYRGFLQYFPRAVAAVANVSEYGFRKYGAWGGWLKVEDAVARYSDGKARHAILQDIEGPYDDGDSGLAHAAQEAWNAMARLELLLLGGNLENRRGNEIENGKPVLGTAKISV